MATIKQIAQELRMDPKLVRDILKETPGLPVAKTVADRVFSTARKMGYDLRKLKLGKRMQVRRETIEEVLQRIGDNPSWGRAEIIRFLRDMQGLVERVHKRVYPEEYGS
ncbi:MAG: hypothetical protein HYY16_09360 [Planctomycetes bacterium]|nr:hypothetical protein [Planctomycetota bacterium]